MPRVVLQNQTVVATDVPRDARQSYFKDCTFTGLDLSDRDLRDCDFVDCTLTNCDLSNAQVRYLQSVRTTWEGCSLPVRLSDGPGKHDLILEALTQARDAAAGRPRQQLTRAVDYITANGYRTSWPDAIQDQVDGGFTLRQVDTVFGAAFTAYPALARAFSATLEAGFVRSGLQPTPNPEGDEIKVTPTDTFRYSQHLGNVSGGDRYLIARRLENEINNRIGRGDVNVWVQWLEPFPNVHILTRDNHEGQFGRWDWWHGVDSMPFQREE